MIKKLLLLSFICLSFYSISFAQTVESDGYLMIQLTNQLGTKSIITIISPDGKSEKIELEKLPALSGSLTEIATRNQAQVLRILETYRQKNYEIVSVTNELQGVFTTYLMRKK